MAKNKLYTPSYFIKRLIDAGYNVEKVFDKYGTQDPRRWTIVVSPTRQSVLVTCYTNKDEYNDIVFEFNDGGAYIPKNFQLHTKSIEVVINYLREYNILDKYGKQEEFKSKPKG